MNTKLRAVLAVLAGIVAGSVVIYVVEMLSTQQPPADLDFTDRVKVGEWIATLPVSAFVILLLAYFLGSIAGGYVTNRIAAASGYRPALVTGFGLFAAGVMNIIEIPHPMWFAVTSSLLYFAGAWLGGRMVPRSPVV